ncbi:MAG: hypothetical protein V4517_14805 [Pseudomonadota bacterium]
MTKTSLLGAAAVLAALTATPALAQHAMHRGGYSHHHGGGFWPGAVAAGVVGGAIGTAAAIASSPYRGSRAYYGNGPEYQYDDSYAYYGNQRGMTTCGVQSYATYMGPDGRWYPC